jgi:hypothetical protein
MGAQGPFGARLRVRLTHTPSTPRALAMHAPIEQRGRRLDAFGITRVQLVWCWWVVWACPTPAAASPIHCCTTFELAVSWTLPDGRQCFWTTWWRCLDPLGLDCSTPPVVQHQAGFGSCSRQQRGASQAPQRGKRMERRVILFDRGAETRPAKN